VSVDIPVEDKNFSKSNELVTFILYLMLQFAYCVCKYRMKNLVFLFLMVFSAQILGQGLQFKFNQDINVSQPFAKKYVP
jgi:hypothetical protein